MKILYLHGIGSGANSRTPSELRKDFPDAVIEAPELPARPMEAYQFLKDNYWPKAYDLIIGTSLGGFYAMAFPAGKKLLVNPAMFADTDIKDGLGLGAKSFFTTRSDGSTEYIIDEAFINELAEIRRKIFHASDNKDIRLTSEEKNNTWALFGTKDELLHHYEDFCSCYLPEHAIRCEAEHRFSTDEIHGVLTPFIKKILA